MIRRREGKTIERRGQPLLGLDLGSDRIRIFQSQKSSVEITPGAWVELELPADIYRGGQLIDPVAVGRLLKAALRSQLRPGTRRVAVAVGGQAALVRRLAMPKLSRRRLRKLLERQGDSWIPFLKEGASLDVAVVKPNLTENEQEVLLVAVPTRGTGPLLTMLRAAGLKLAALDVDMAALFRAAVATGTLPPEGTAAVLDINSERARLALVEQRHLVMVRSLDPPPQGLGGIDLRLVDEFLVEVRRSLEIMTAALRDGPELAAMLVISPWPTHPLLPPLERELKAAMGGRLAADFRLVSGEETGLPPGMALPFGLSLVQAQPPYGMDLVPRQRSPVALQRQIAAGAAAVTLLAFLGYGIGIMRQMPAMAEAIRIRQTELRTAQEALRQAPSIALEEAEAAKLRPLLQRLGLYQSRHDALARLIALLPPGVEITSLTLELPRVTLVGEAYAPEQVSLLLEALAASPEFQQPALSFVGNSSETVTYQISLTLATQEGATE